jgi:hypothetical protein
MFWAKLRRFPAMEKAEMPLDISAWQQFSHGYNCNRKYWAEPVVGIVT